MTNQHKLISNGAKALGAKFLGIGLGFLLSIVVAREFGIRATGLVALGVSVGAIVGQVGSAGTKDSISKWVAENIELGRVGYGVAAVNVAFFFSLLMTTILACMTVAVIYFGGKQFVATEEIWLFSGILYGSALVYVSSVNIAALTGIRKSWQAVALQSIPVPLLTLGVMGVWMLAADDIDFLDYVEIWLFMSIIAVLMPWWYWLKSAPRAMDKRSVPLRRLLFFSQPFFVGSLVFLAIGHVDNMMLGFFGSKEDLGGYAVAYKVASTIVILQAITDSFTVPRIASHAATKNYLKVIEVASKSTTYILILAFPISVFFIIFSSQILSIWGPEFKSFSLAFTILILAQFVNVSAGPSGRVLLFCGFGWLRNAIALTALFMDIILNYFLIRLYGANGAAIATSLSVLFMYSAYWIYSGIKLRNFIYPRVKHIKSLF